MQCLRDPAGLGNDRVSCAQSPSEPGRPGSGLFEGGPELIPSAEIASVAECGVEQSESYKVAGEKQNGRQAGGEAEDEPEAAGAGKGEGGSEGKGEP
jgi:hypothetical protein